MIFDTHIHLNDDKLSENLEEYLKRANELGIKKFLCVGYDFDSSLKAIKIANKFSNVYASIGVIPTEHKSWNNSYIDKFKELYKKNSKKIIAIGEIGLDYYREKEEDIKIKQKDIFIKQINLANELNLPISIHCRDAIQDCFDILKENKCDNKGIMHCYSGSKEMAKEFIKLGYKIAFGGVLTFKNSIITKEVIKSISLEDIVLETDAPYLAPTPFRGKINLPEYIKNISLYASSLLNIDNEEFENITFKNSLDILKIKND